MTTDLRAHFCGSNVRPNLAGSCRVRLGIEFRARQWAGFGAWLIRRLKNSRNLAVRSYNFRQSYTDLPQFPKKTAPQQSGMSLDIV